MEIKLPSEMSFSYDTENAISTLSGTCVTYPGFNPHPGDVFVYRIDNGQYGLFRIINTPERLSIRTGTMHSCEFTLDHILDTETYQQLEDKVRQQAYFNKQRFLMESSALLTHEEMLDYKLLLKQYEMLSKEYVRYFYDQTVKSFIRPDGIYDPYLVDFIQKVCGSYVYEKYVMQLLPSIKDMFNVDLLWDKLLDRDNVGFIADTAEVVTYTVDSKEVRPTGLINRKYLRYSADGEDTITCFNIASWNASTYTKYEHVVAVYLLYGIVEHLKIQELVELVRTAPLEEKFYQIPVLLFFIRKLINALKTGAPLKYTTTDIEPYVTFKIKETDVDENNVLNISLNGGTPVAVVAADGEVLYLDDVDITSNMDTGYTINLAPLLAAHPYPITDLAILATNGLIQ